MDSVIMCQIIYILDDTLHKSVDISTHFETFQDMHLHILNIIYT